MQIREEEALPPPLISGGGNPLPPKTTSFARCKSDKKPLDAGFPRHYRKGFRGFPGVSKGFQGYMKNCYL